MGGEQAGGTPKFRTGCRLRRTLDTQVELSAGSGICESGDRMQVPQVTFMELIPRANAPEWGKKPARWAVSQTASGLGELGLFSTPAPIRRVWAPLTTRTGLRKEVQEALAASPSMFSLWLCSSSGIPCVLCDVLFASPDVSLPRAAAYLCVKRTSQHVDQMPWLLADTCRGSENSDPENDYWSPVGRAKAGAGRREARG